MILIGTGVSYCSLDIIMISTIIMPFSALSDLHGHVHRIYKNKDIF